MRFWWVNHKQAFRHEFTGQYIWCPKRKADGRQNHFYETVREVCPGDLVFSFAFAALQGFGFAKTHCYSCPRPNEFGSVGDAWDIRGWRVDVGFRRFVEPLRVADHVGLIAPLLPSAYSPIQSNGRGNQGAYFSEISRGLALVLSGIVNPPMASLLQARAGEEAEGLIDFNLPLISEWEDQQEKLIVNSEELSETQRKALVLARRGQGLFRRRVTACETFCRVTKVDNLSHLVASHIKPWREASHQERLEASNGLLLTPTIDHLFDRGFISFSDDGDVIISPITDRISLSRMGVNPEQPPRVGKFNADQRHFLDYHRKEILLKSAA